MGRNLLAYAHPVAKLGVKLACFCHHAYLVVVGKKTKKEELSLEGDLAKGNS
jgi:hypothetical protein